MKTVGFASGSHPVSYSAYTAIDIPLFSWARQQRIPLEELLADTGLSGENPELSRVRMRAHQRLQLLRNLLALTEIPNPGLEIGHLARLEYLGVFGLMMLVAPTVQDAFASGARYSPASSTPGTLEFSMQENTGVLSYLIPDLEPRLASYIIDDCFAAVSEYLRVLAPKKREPRLLAARFAYPRPRSVSAHRQLVDARSMSFDCDVAQLEVTTRVLRMQPPLANRFTFDQCQEMLDTLLAELREAGARFEDARRLIADHAGELRTLEDLSVLMGVSRRSLQRMFQQHGTCFKDVLAESRSALAQDLLRNRALSVNEVAGLVGYEDVPNFRRAFLRWTGISPAAYRKSVGSAQRM